MTEYNTCNNLWDFHRGRRSPAPPPPPPGARPSRPTPSNVTDCLVNIYFIKKLFTPSPDSLTINDEMLFAQSLQIQTTKKPSIAHNTCTAGSGVVVVERLERSLQFLFSRVERRSSSCFTCFFSILLIFCRNYHLT